MDSRNVAEQLKATQEQKQKQSVDNVEAFKNFNLKYPGIVEALDNLYDGENEDGVSKIDIYNEMFSSDNYKTAPGVHLCTRLDTSKIIDNGPETKTSKGIEQVSYKTDLLKFDNGGRKINVDIQTFIATADIIDGTYGPVLKLVYDEENRYDDFLKESFAEITGRCREIAIFRNIVTGKNEAEKRTRSEMMIESPVYEQVDDNGNIVVGLPKSTLVKPLNYSNQKSNMVPALGQNTSGKSVSSVTRIPFNYLIGIRIAAQFNIHVHSLYITSGSAKIQLHLRSAVIFRIMESIGGSVSVDAQLNFLSNVVKGFSDVSLNIPKQIVASSSNDEYKSKDGMHDIHIPTKPGENIVDKDQTNPIQQMQFQMTPGFIQNPRQQMPQMTYVPQNSQEARSYQSPQSPNMTNLHIGNTNNVQTQQSEILEFLSKGSQ